MKKEIHLYWRVWSKHPQDLDLISDPAADFSLILEKITMQLCRGAEVRL